MSRRGLKTRISTSGQTAWLLAPPDILGAFPPPLHRSVVEKFLQTIGRLEDLRDFTVQLANNFVDGLLPWWVCILSSHDGNKELSKSYLGYLKELIRYLCRRTTKKTQTINDEEQINTPKKCKSTRILNQTRFLDWKRQIKSVRLNLQWQFEDYVFVEDFSCLVLCPTRGSPK